MILYNQIGGKLVNLYHQFWLSVAFVNIFLMFLMKKIAFKMIFKMII